MPRVLRTSAAHADLLEIWLYVAGESTDAADRLLTRVDVTCNMLAENQAAGRARDELAPGIRSFPVDTYLLFYRPIDEGIELIRVLHSARDIPSIFKSPE